MDGFQDKPVVAHVVAAVPIYHGIVAGTGERREPRVGLDCPATVTAVGFVEVQVEVLDGFAAILIFKTVEVGYFGRAEVAHAHRAGIVVGNVVVFQIAPGLDGVRTRFREVGLGLEGIGIRLTCTDGFGNGLGYGRLLVDLIRNLQIGYRVEAGVSQIELHGLLSQILARGCRTDRVDTDVVTLGRLQLHVAYIELVLVGIALGMEAQVDVA